MKQQKHNFAFHLFTIFAIIMLLIVTAVLYAHTIDQGKELTFQERAAQFCNKNGAVSVAICNNQLIATTMQNQIKYLHQDGTAFSCPTIIQNGISTECQNIANAKQNNIWNCQKIC